jgi:hypothetical protein
VVDRAGEDAADERGGFAHGGSLGLGVKAHQPRRLARLNNVVRPINVWDGAATPSRGERPSHNVRAMAPFPARDAA